MIFPETFSEAVGLKVTLMDVLWPAPSVSGVVMPLAVTSFALTVTWESVTLELPLFVIVTGLELEVPALMLPKAMLEGLAERVTVAAVPVPLKATALGEFGALLAIVTLPVKLPELVGAKSTLNDAVPPAAMVAGVVNPLTLKPLPLSATCEMVSAADPVFVIVKLWDLVCPSTMLPKL